MSNVIFNLTNAPKKTQPAVYPRRGGYYIVPHTADRDFHGHQGEWLKKISWSHEKFPLACQK